MSMEPEVIVALRFVAEAFDPAKLSALLGVEPTHHWKQGDEVKATSMKRKESGWSFERRDRTWDVAEAIDKLLDTMSYDPTKVRAAQSAMRIRSQLSVVVYCDESFPALAFGSPLLRRLADGETSLDIDIILSEG